MVGLRNSGQHCPAPRSTLSAAAVETADVFRRGNFMAQEREWLFEVLKWARQANQRAKAALLLILETERKPTILWKLRNADVWYQDLGDAHHDVVVRVDENITDLRETRAYYKWESRIINDICCRNYRRYYRKLGEPLEIVLAEIEANHD
jgi:hypothetical protein